MQKGDVTHVHVAVIIEDNARPPVPMAENYSGADFEFADHFGLSHLISGCWPSPECSVAHEAQRIESACRCPRSKQPGIKFHQYPVTVEYLIITSFVTGLAKVFVAKAVRISAVHPLIFLILK